MYIKKTKKFYENLPEDFVCSCGYCENYVKNIRSSYPDLSKELMLMGIDIEKPFECYSIDQNPDEIRYNAQYIVIGKKKDFKMKRFKKYNVEITENHPNTEIKEKHYVIEIFDLVLPFTEDFDKSMDDYWVRVEELSEKSCYIIDFLPMTVPEDSEGDFFDVEYYFLNSDRRDEIGNKFTNILLKFMCYYSAEIYFDDRFKRSSPELIEETMREIMTKYSGSMYLLFDDGKMMAQYEWDCLHLTFYNPDERAKEILACLASSEGLFWRKSEN